MCKCGLGLVLELTENLRREHLAELNTPLIEGVDVPDCGLGEDGMLVKRNQLAQYAGREHLSENRV